MANDPELNIRISAELADLRAKLDTAQRQLRALGETGHAAGRRASAGVDGIGASVGTMARSLARAGAVAAAAGVALTGAFVKSAIDSADATGVLAGKLGITTEALSKLQYAAKLSDVSQQSLEAGLRGLAKTLTAATDPADEAAEALAAINLSAEDLLKLPADEQIGAIADALSRVENPALQAGLSMKIFGKSGQDMLPLVQEGSAGIKRLGAELEDLGGVMSGDMVADAMQFNDNLDTLKTAAQGFGLALADALLPHLNNLTQDLIDLAKERETAEGIAAFITGIADAVLATARVISATGNVFTFLGQEIAALVGGAAVGDLSRLYDQLERLQNRRAMANPLRPDVIQKLDDEIAKTQQLIAVSEDLVNAEARAKTATQAAAAARAQSTAQGPQQVISEAKIAAALRSGASAQETAARAAEQRQKAISNLIDKLQEEVDTHGQAESATIDYKLAQMGATDAERARAAALAATTARLKEQDAAQQRINDQLPGVRNDLLRLQGNDAAAAENELRQRYAQLLSDLTQMGNTAGIAIVENLIDLSAADARLNALRDKVAEANSEFDRVQQNAAARVEIGDLTPAMAQGEVTSAAARATTDLQALRAEMQLLADQDVPGAREELENLDITLNTISAQSVTGLARTLQDLRGELAQMNADFAGDTVLTLRDSLSGLFTDLAEGAKTGKEALQDFARNFAMSMARIAADALATMAVLALLDAIYPGLGKMVAAGSGVTAGVKHAGGIAGEGGTTRQVPGYLFAGAAHYHSGGIAGLAPGEVPAILRKGEEVITANDPRHIANAAAGGSLQNVRINLLDDRSNVGDYMASSEGERVLFEVLERNALRARTLLGN